MSIDVSIYLCLYDSAPEQITLGHKGERITKDFFLFIVSFKAKRDGCVLYSSKEPHIVTNEDAAGSFIPDRRQ